VFQLRMVISLKTGSRTAEAEGARTRRGRRRIVVAAEKSRCPGVATESLRQDRFDSRRDALHIRTGGGKHDVSALDVGRHVVEARLFEKTWWTAPQ
jgi:hypothetical protein